MPREEWKIICDFSFLSLRAEQMKALNMRNIVNAILRNQPLDLLTTLLSLGN